MNSNKDEVLRLAKEAGFVIRETDFAASTITDPETALRFAALLESKQAQQEQVDSKPWFLCCGVANGTGGTHHARDCSHPKQAQQPSAPTDISKRLRQYGVSGDVSDGALLIQAADEIERYYGGMLAWKATAEAKDREAAREQPTTVKFARYPALSEASRQVSQELQSLRRSFEAAKKTTSEDKPVDEPWCVSEGRKLRAKMVVKPEADPEPSAQSNPPHEGWMDGFSARRLITDSGFDGYELVVHGRRFTPYPNEFEYLLMLMQSAVDKSAAQSDSKDAEYAAMYRYLREQRPVLLVTGFFGNGCINKDMDDVEDAIRASAARQAGKERT